jgi:hypothetical protein
MTARTTSSRLRFAVVMGADFPGTTLSASLLVRLMPPRLAAFTTTVGLQWTSWRASAPSRVHIVDISSIEQQINSPCLYLTHRTLTHDQVMTAIAYFRKSLKPPDRKVFSVLSQSSLSLGTKRLAAISPAICNQVYDVGRFDEFG